MITVVCVYRTGRTYSWDYVKNLVQGISLNLTVEHKIVCLSDELPIKPGFAIKRLKYGWPEWWSKMEIFGISGPVLYFDLDTVVVGSLNELANLVINLESNQILTLEDFYLKGKRPSTGILGWSGDVSRILETFILEASGARWTKEGVATWMIRDKVSFRGDQEWLRLYMAKESDFKPIFAQHVLQGIFSYKVDVRINGKLPDDAKVVCFHGKPRPHEVATDEWMPKYWRELNAGNNFRP